VFEDSRRLARLAGCRLEVVYEGRVGDVQIDVGTSVTEAGDFGGLRDSEVWTR
jgi:hypothetical protein